VKPNFLLFSQARWSK